VPHAEFATEFPNEPVAPWAAGSTGSVQLTGGYIAPGNPFAPVPVGEPRINEWSEAGQEYGLPEVGPGYVFVRGEGFVEVRDTPYFDEGSPTDWEAVAANYEIEAPPAQELVFADIPVIDPTFDPYVTVGETSSGDPVAVESEEPVAFWDTVGDIFTTTLPGAIDAYGTGQGWWGTAPPTGGTPFAGSGPGYQAYIGQPLATPAQVAAPVTGAAPMQDPGQCPPPGARYLRYNCQTGQLSKIPRRRRRRLLTSSDLKDLAALKAIVGGGAKMDGAIVAAVRR